MSLTASVITPTRNRAAMLVRCLHYLSEQSLAPDRYEVLVIDDASTDETRSVIETAVRTSRCPVRPFWLRERRGVPGARNHAIREARGDVVVFVDSDNFASPSFLAAHVAIHEAHPNAVGRGPVIATRSIERPFAVRGGLLDLSTAYFDTDNASVRRAHLDQVGLFNEVFYPYGWEGLDLGFRLRALGLRRVYRRDAALYHYHEEVSPESLDGLLRKEAERARTAWLFYEKHPTLEARFALQFTPFHLALNTVQRLFGLVGPGNVEACVRWADRSGAPGLGRLLLSGVLNAHYLAHLHANGQMRPGSRAHGD
ncbi:MAG TPA: glycosyltransferase family A protein [bacterium]|nr:glycosyltransferase family A protein [bacterium]